MNMITPRKTRQGREYWEAHIARWREKGTSMSAYCQEHGIAYASFSNWKRRIKEDDEAVDSTFIEISMPAVSPQRAERTFELEHNGLRFTIREDVDAARLLEILAAVRRSRLC